MFLKAFEDSRNPESYIEYLSAVRMRLSDKEYVNFVADNEEVFEASLELEKRMNEALDLYGASDDRHNLGTISVIKAEGKMHEYYDMVGENTRNIKEEYRSLVREKLAKG